MSAYFAKMLRSRLYSLGHRVHDRIDCLPHQTGIFVLGPEKGIELAESLDGVEALVVSPDLETRMTSGFAARFREEPTEPGLP